MFQQEREVSDDEKWHEKKHQLHRRDHTKIHAHMESQAIEY